MTPPRAAAILGLLAALGALYGLASTPAFALARTDIPELQWTTRESVMAAIGTPNGVNLFQLQTGPLEDRIRALPGVASATVAVSLPDTITVQIQEREAILDWVIGDSHFLVDRDGVIFASLAAGDDAVVTLPAVFDSRPESAALRVGAVLDPVDLDAATRLASL
ncbi:MAG: FtsQ-type POTRA domain-containing protein, partial [Chloroflexota bacterium]